jgi:hypothetical protein
MLVFERYEGAQVTEDMLSEASNLSSEDYGVWCENAVKPMGSFAKAGTHEYVFIT